jgi:mRNA interferase RelE/StbE
MKVNISDQVRNFVLCLAPEPRKRLREALLMLESEKGDIKALENDLSGYFRLRVRAYRVIFAYRAMEDSGVAEIECVFCERRSIVYEAFAALSARLQGR